MKKLIFISLLCLSAFLTKAQTLRINKYLVDSMISAGVQVLYYDTTHTGQWKNISEQAGGGSGANNYPTSIAFSSNRLTLNRNGLSAITADWDSSIYHSMGFYDVRYAPISGSGNYIKAAGTTNITGNVLIDGASARDFSIWNMRSLQMLSDYGYTSIQNYLYALDNTAALTYNNFTQSEVGYVIKAATDTSSQPEFSLYASPTTPDFSYGAGRGNQIRLRPNEILFTNAGGGTFKVKGLPTTTDTTWKPMVWRSSDSTWKVLESWGNAGAVTSVSGTTNRITSTGGATPVIDIAATYVGQTSITTLGTIATGVWDATNIGYSKLTLTGSVVNADVNASAAIDATKLIDGSITNTELGYINTLTSNAQTQIDGKQATLVSGTNIKTINGSSILGSGDLVVSGSITGTDTHVLFFDGNNNPAGDAGMTYNKTTDALTVGKVGAGGAPTRIFSIVSSTATSLSSFNTSGGEIAYFGVGSSVISGGDPNELGFAAPIITFAAQDGTRRLSVANNGEVLINTTDQTTAFLQVGGNIWSSGNILMGGTSIATSATAAFHLFNGTVPSASITNGVLLYSEDVAASAELKVRDEAGNITVLGPHTFIGIPGGRSEEMAWAFYSERDGKYINVDMLKLARAVEKLTGEKLVFIGKTTDELPNKENK